MPKTGAALAGLTPRPWRRPFSGFFPFRFSTPSFWRSPATMGHARSVKTATDADEG
jgi:hypothetical protein